MTTDSPETCSGNYCSDVSDRGFLTDDPKPCIASDYTATDPALVQVWEGSYFISMLLNDRCSRDFRTAGEIVTPVSEATSYVASHLLPDGNLVPLGSRPFASHLGANTLAFTSDGKLKLWHQSSANLHSKHLMAPTGSGSFDMVDLMGPESESIEQAAIVAMERELTEETPNIRILESRLVGFWRDLERGGLPGFLGITKVADRDSALFPDGQEVEDRLTPAFDAGNLQELKETIDLLLSDPSVLSRPLYANLKAVRQMAAEQPELLRSFLWG